MLRRCLEIVLEDALKLYWESWKGLFGSSNDTKGSAWRSLPTSLIAYHGYPISLVITGYDLAFLFEVRSHTKGWRRLQFTAVIDTGYRIA